MLALPGQGQERAARGELRRREVSLPAGQVLRRVLGHRRQERPVRPKGKFISHSRVAHLLLFFFFFR